MFKDFHPWNIAIATTKPLYYFKYLIKIDSWRRRKWCKSHVVILNSEIQEKMCRNDCAQFYQDRFFFLPLSFDSWLMALRKINMHETRQPNIEQNIEARSDLENHQSRTFTVRRRRRSSFTELSPYHQVVLLPGII